MILDPRRAASSIVLTGLVYPWPTVLVLSRGLLAEGSQRLHDAGPEVPGHLVPAAAGRHHDPQLRLEVERLQAAGAAVEVAADLGPPVGGELAVEEPVELAQGRTAVGRVVAVRHWPGAPGRRRRSVRPTHPRALPGGGRPGRVL